MPKAPKPAWIWVFWEIWASLSAASAAAGVFLSVFGDLWHFLKFAHKEK